MNTINKTVSLFITPVRLNNRMNFDGALQKDKQKLNKSLSNRYKDLTRQIMYCGT